MSGGVALPGDATTADVLSGSTFSAGSGVGLTGVAANAIGSIVQIGALTNYDTLAFPNDVKAGNSIILLLTQPSNQIAPTAISGIAGTWAQAAAESNQALVWYGTNANGTSNSATLTGPVSGGTIGGIAFEIEGSIALTDAAAAAAASVALTSIPAGGLVVVAVYTGTSSPVAASFLTFTGAPMAGVMNNTYNISGFGIGTNQPAATSPTITGAIASASITAIAAASFSVS